MKIDRNANFTELSKVFKIMSILFNALLIIQADGIANFTNCFQ